MNKREAIEKYNEQVKFSILAMYRDAETYFEVNKDDPDLKPIRISLPEPPDWGLIEGFGKKYSDQYFVKTEMPARLTELQNKTADMMADSRQAKDGAVTLQRIIDEVWAQLNSRQVEFMDEIEWIKRQIWHCHYGYWFFNNGQPTYIDGWHYRFLNFWDMTDANVEYRDRDRRWFLFQRFAFTCTQDAEGNELGRRVCFGVAGPKHRRAGDTHKSLCIGYDIMTKTIGNVIGGIQSFDDDNAREHYQNKLIPSFKSMHFFLKPTWKGSQAPQSELHFTRIDNRLGAELGSKMNFATTAYRKFYDGKKCYFLQLEEEGKTKQEDIYLRWMVVKLCLAQGPKIHGFSIHPTTVEEMVSEGGANFEKLCTDSKFYERNEKTGQTKTGLFRLFFPAYDGLDQFIDRYGMSVIENPTKEQADFIGWDIGAKEYLQSVIDNYLRDGSAEAMEKMRSEQRKHPTSYAKCFSTIGGDVGFNIEKLDAAIERLSREANVNGNPQTVKGNFMWLVDGAPEPLMAKDFIELGYDRLHREVRVEFFPDPEGKWDISKMLLENESNLRFKQDGIWFPLNPMHYTHSADPFHFLKEAESDRRNDKAKWSKGGIATFWERDKGIDPDAKDVKDWESYRFVCTYYGRSSGDDVYAEEALMQTVYFGGEMFPERNVPLINKHFIKRGYGGYLKYEMDELTRKPKEEPGYYSLRDKKQELFKAIQRYIERHAVREKHIDFLIQCRKIKGIEYMTDFDLFTACGGCLLGSQVVRFEYDNEEMKDNSTEYLDAMPTYSY